MASVDLRLVNPDGQSGSLSGAFAYQDPIPPPQPPSDTGNDYFNALVGRSDCYRSYSLRDPQQLTYKSLGGYAQGAPPKALTVTYDPAFDAAAVRVPCFVDNGYTLAQPLSATGTQVWPSKFDSSHNIANYVIRIDDEILNITARDATLTSFFVTRGYWGTPISAHAAGAVIFYSSTSLDISSQIWCPMNSQDGHTYLTTWDVWYPKDMTKGLVGFGNWKQFQFRRNIPSPHIWFEVRSRFDLAPTVNDVGTIDFRGYTTLGPNVTKDQPLAPQIHPFVLRPERWIRYTMLLDQRANDWDLISFWAADWEQGVVQLLDGIQMDTSDGVDPPSVDSFQLEFNSGQRLTLKRPDWIVHVKNVVMLKDVQDVTSVLVKPIQ